MESEDHLRTKVAELDTELAQVTQQIHELRQKAAELSAQRAVYAQALDEAAERLSRVDWAADFEWAPRIEDIKCRVFGIQEPFRLCVLGAGGGRIPSPTARPALQRPERGH